MDPKQSVISFVPSNLLRNSSTLTDHFRITSDLLFGNWNTEENRHNKEMVMIVVREGCSGRSLCSDTNSVKLYRNYLALAIVVSNISFLHR